jgi:hypothetical protein
MLWLRTSSHIHARRDIRSFHSCAASTGWSTVHLDTQRIHQERLALATGRSAVSGWSGGGGPIYCITVSKGDSKNEN